MEKTKEEEGAKETVWEFPGWKIAETALNGRSTRLFRTIYVNFTILAVLQGPCKNTRWQLCFFSHEFRDTKVAAEI